MILMRMSCWSLVLLMLSVPCQAESLYQSATTSQVLDAARQIIAGDPDCALITVDAKGQPRARTVTASAPEDDMTIWIATKPNTRKVTQLREHAQVTLYFSNDAAFSYVSIMGTATLHEDLATIEAKNFYPPEQLRVHWPNYPEDFLLIEVTPTWIEVEGHGMSGHAETWQPQGVRLD